MGALAKFGIFIVIIAVILMILSGFGMLSSFGLSQNSYLLFGGIMLIGAILAFFGVKSDEKKLYSGLLRR